MPRALHPPVMTRESFLDWVERQDGRYEFDGFEPVSMGGSTVGHSRIAQELWRAINRQLAGTGCEALLQDGAIETVGDALRFADVTVTCSPLGRRDRIISKPVLVFEVISPSNERTDRILKLEEYRAVPSISTFVVLEQDSAALTVFCRQAGNQWAASALTSKDILIIDAPSLRIPVSEIYARVDFDGDAA